MNKRSLYTGAFALMLCGGAFAQAPLRPVSGLKWDATIEDAFQRQAGGFPVHMGLRATGTEETGIKTLITCSDAEKVASVIKEAGYEATVITSRIVTAEIPLSLIKTVATLDEVERVEQAHQRRPTMTEARTLTNANAIHTGEGLETPFTGKGVIIGIIDQGFEWRHLAFLDSSGKPRARAAWNHQSAASKPTTTIPTGGDGLATGHATHVANIAAGSRVAENSYYGMAPDAELIFISSQFDDSRVLEETKYVRDFAEAEGKRWVVNMSFGSQIGPHDGTTTYCQAMNEVAGQDGFLVAAMGNEGGDNLHTSYTFTKEGEVKRILLSPDESNTCLVADLWGMAADGAQHLQVKPFVYLNKNVSYESDSYWKSVGTVTSEINSNNKKEHYYFMINSKGIESYSGTGAQFGLEITGEAGQTFHFWVNPTYGTITTPSGLGSMAYLKGDPEYCVGEGAATIPAAIGVGAYTSAGSWKSYTGATQSFVQNKVVGEICTFSSHGPLLSDEILRPTICAPGSAIKSAISSYSSDFSSTSQSIVSVVTRSGIKESKYYYAVMAGTSMSTPAVSGILALWLEANPNLTRAQVEDILKTTAIRDSYTGTEEWNAVSGYGKIDAYAGIKEALRLANSSGINETLNSEVPVTISMGAEEWRILFNNNESYADITLHTASGAQVEHLRLSDISRGHETVLNLQGYTPGVYLLGIRTTKGSLTRKILVR